MKNLLLILSTLGATAYGGQYKCHATLDQIRGTKNMGVRFFKEPGGEKLLWIFTKDGGTGSASERALIENFYETCSEGGRSEINFYLFGGAVPARSCNVQWDRRAAMLTFSCFPRKIVGKSFEVKRK